MLLESNATNFNHVKGWIFDLYPSYLGQMYIWIITENGERKRLLDKFQPKIYVSGREENLEVLATRFFENDSVEALNFVHKYLRPTETAKSEVLEIVIKDYRNTQSFARRVLELGEYLRFQVYNSDLRSTQAYLYERGIFPFAFAEIEVKKHELKYHLLDSVESIDYSIPPLRIMRVHANIAKKGTIVNFDDPLREIVVSNESEKITIDSGDEKKKLLQFVELVRKSDPDILLTHGGDSHLFPYLARRALANGILNKLILGRENISLAVQRKQGTTLFSYGRTYYRAPTMRLYGRVHIDTKNTFIHTKCGFDGLIEVARTCRVPLHRASRISIGSSMSSLQIYQSLRDDILIPRNKSVPEIFKSAYELLVGDRGGFVFEPKMGIHDWVGEVDFSSMYPSLLVKNNISIETVHCKCCPDSALRIPELGYNICEKRVGIVPKTLKFVISKRLRYKRLKNEAADLKLKEVYERRQGALKWILVTCFGYLGYKNAKFGTIDGHIGVCAFGRNAFLKAARTAEEAGFKIIHGIVDSLWLKKRNATVQEFLHLSKRIHNKIGVPLSFEGRYKWIVFLPSKIHPNIAVLNSYYGVKENGRIKIRGIEARRRDTPKFVSEAQMAMIRVLATASNSENFIKKISAALNVVKEYRDKLIHGEVPVWELIVTKRLSKDLESYKQKISQVAVAEQLRRKGVEVPAGKSVRFLFTSAENKKYNRRVRAEELINDETNADIGKYLLLLYSAASNILSPFGYTTKDIYESVRGHQPTKLAQF